MPKGIPAKKKVDDAEPKPLGNNEVGNAVSGRTSDSESKPEVKNETKEEAKKEIVNPVLNKCRPPHLPSCQCQDPLAAGQTYFEDGPTGTILIGEDTKSEVFFRAGNGGRGCLINKKR